MAFHVPEKFRVKDGLLASTVEYGNNGCFVITSPKLTRALKTIASDGLGFEHCSVSHLSKTGRPPIWNEMCFIKDLFWDDEDVVMQLHPAKSEYVDIHPFCLHLWKPIGIEIPRPHQWMV